MPGDHRVDARARRVTGPRSRLIAAAVEVLAAVALTTGAVAALEPAIPAVRLEALYLLAVLAIAIRRGELAALATALLSGLAVNFFFLTPRHQLAIAHSRDFVQLVVLLIAAVVVGRLAATARQRAAEAESRARVATIREREATLVAYVASAILAGRSLATQLDSIGQRVAQATGASAARLVLAPVPDPADGELVVPLPARGRTAWLYVGAETGWARADLERIAVPLGRLLEVALERERLADVAAESEAARRADTARTAILHTLSHDLRTPLTAITTAGGALRAPALTDAERSELLDVIDHEGARLADLMSDLLDLSRIQAGAVAPQPDWCDLGEIAAAAAAGLRGEHPIEFALPVSLPLVRADAAQLERVFSNLLENAVRYSPPSEPVRITAGVGAALVTVRIIDQGRGISGADRARVFEPFLRLRGAAGPAGAAGSGSGSGSGLGLAICRGFVEANGGRIVLQSGAGRGTSFAVSLPLQEQPSTAGPPA